MTVTDGLNLLKGYLGSQQYGPEARTKTAPPVFVTLSRETGAGGITIGMALQARLQAETGQPWLWLDRNLVERVIEEHNLPKEVASIMEQSQYHRVLKWMDDLLGQYPDWTSLARKTGQTILHLAQMGNVIIVGRGGNLLTRDLPGGLHVRVIGSMPRRIAHCAEYYHLTPREAEHFVVREDSGRAMYVKDLFDADVADPHLYNLTINTDVIGYSGAVALTASALHARRAQLAGA